MNTAIYTLPDHLLPCLFNDDETGLTAGEAREFLRWFAATFPNGAWAISSVPVGFRKRHDFNDIGEDCHEVTFQIPDSQPEGRQDPNLEDCISASDLRVIEAMRARGWAVALFTPAELHDIDSYDVEAQMIAAGNDCIVEWRGGK